MRRGVSFALASSYKVDFDYVVSDGELSMLKILDRIRWNHFKSGVG